MHSGGGMPLLSDQMTDPDRPVTRLELRAELEDILKTLATKEDLKAFATKEDLKAFATKEDLKAFATKEDLKAFATKEDLKQELTAYATKDDLNGLRDELRTQFKVVTESVKERWDNLYDWSHANTDGLDRRLVDLEGGYGRRLLNVESRVTLLESRRKRP